MVLLQYGFTPNGVTRKWCRPGRAAPPSDATVRSPDIEVSVFCHVGNIHMHNLTDYLALQNTKLMIDKYTQN